MMEFTNAATKWPQCGRALLEPFALLLAPYAPHMAEEVWSMLGHGSTLAYEPWPRWAPEHLVKSIACVAIQVNGKVHARSATPPRRGTHPRASRAGTHRRSAARWTCRWTRSKLTSWQQPVSKQQCSSISMASR